MSSHNNNVAKMPSQNSFDYESDHGETCKFNCYDLSDNEDDSYLKVTQYSTPDFYKLSPYNPNPHHNKVDSPPSIINLMDDRKPAARKQLNMDGDTILPPLKNTKVSSYTTKKGTKVKAHKRAHKNTKSITHRIKQNKPLFGHYHPLAGHHANKADLDCIMHLIFQDKINLAHGINGNN